MISSEIRLCDDDDNDDDSMKECPLLETTNKVIIKSTKKTKMRQSVLHKKMNNQVDKQNQQ
jgi:hypothetical protein